MRVSVALCTRDGEAYVEEQVASILAQRRAVDEIVLSDDGSSDLTVERALGAVEQHAGTSPEVVVLRTASPRGVRGNFEHAVTACTGDVVLLCDQDDRWHVDKVGAIVRVLEDPSILLAASDADLVDAAGRPLGRRLSRAQLVTEAERLAFERGDALSVLVRRNVVTGATVGFRRELLAWALPFPSDWVHDEWLAAVAASVGGLALLEDVLVDYRQHGGNVVGVGRGPLDRLRLLVQPRAERNDRLVRRAQAWHERLGQHGVDADRVAVVAGKLAHERRRRSLPRWRPARVWPVLAAAHRGDYDRYGLGRKDVLRDLLQPPGDRA